MIVADEQLDSPEILTAFEHWYPGRVAVVTELRPATQIDDPDIATLLREHRGAAFVTVNWADFWLRVSPGARFAIICVRVPQSRAADVPSIVRQLFRQPAFATRRQRNGKVILASAGGIRYYERLPGAVWALEWRRDEAQMSRRRGS